VDKDCPDGSDEMNCTIAPSCPSGEWSCEDGRTCIPEKWKCDGFSDCAEGSDEKNCAARVEVNCTESQVGTLTPALSPKSFLDCHPVISDSLYFMPVKWILFIGPLSLINALFAAWTLTLKRLLVLFKLSM